MERNRQGPQNFWFALPPPVERHVNVGFANDWQYAVGSVVPPFGAAAIAVEEQLRKQYVWGADSSGAHTSVKPEGHSPGTAQQSLSEVHVCVQ